jgi:hypothetical protein
MFLQIGGATLAVGGYTSTAAMTFSHQGERGEEGMWWCRRENGQRRRVGDDLQSESQRRDGGSGDGMGAAAAGRASRKNGGRADYRARVADGGGEGVGPRRGRG